MKQPRFEELDFRTTPIGDLSLRRRQMMSPQVEVYEIKLGDEYLMSSLFTTSEIALGERALEHHGGTDIDVAVGGLGLGYTARAVLGSARVRSLVVVELLEAVIGWHREGLLPIGAELCGDSRCRIVQADFFAAARSQQGLDPDVPQRRFDAVLVDIDHSPEMLLSQANGSFYQREGLARLTSQLKPAGIFGLWSNDPPNPLFTDRLSSVFAESWAEPISFHNPLQDTESVQTLYFARGTALLGEPPQTENLMRRS